MFEAVILGGTLLLGAFVLWPALRGTGERWEFSEEDTPLGRLAVRKEVLLGNLADLDFEFAMGKLGDEDYRSLRESLKGQTMKIMEQMDVLASSDTGVASPSGAASTPQVENTCSDCSGILPGQARFCPHCGAPTDR